MLPGMGNIDPKKMKKIMDKMNMKMEEIAAEEVIIKTRDGSIIISEPEVMLVDMMGKDVFQISGEVSEGSQEQMISEEDVRMIMAKTGKDKETVVETLKKLNNDLARTIMELKEK